MKIPSITLPSSAALTSGLGDAFKTMADSLLSGIPYTQHARLLTLKTAQASNLTDTLVVESFTGHEAINQLFCFDVQALSISASVDCQQFIGEEISLRLLQVDGSYRAWHGYCTEAAFLGADGGFSRYALRLEPFLAFLKHRHNAVVFQDKNAQEIISTLLAAYPESTLRWDVTQALPTYPLRTQYRESDFDFFCRILAEVGLSWRFEHEQERQDAQPFAAANGSGNAADDESDSLQHSKHAKHTLVIFDSKAAIPVLPQQSHLRYHGIRATDKEDAVDTFSAEHQIQANAVCVSSWDYKQLQATAAEQTAALSALERETLPLLQVYHGNGAQRFANDAAAEAMAERVLQGLALHSQGFVGQGSVRKLAAGFGFSLTQHEQFGVSALHSIDSGDAADAGAGAGAGHYTVLSVTHQGWNNLSAAHNAMRNAAHNATLSAGVTDLTSHGERGTYRNHFTCVRADVAIVPTLPSLPAGANQTLNNQLAHHARPRTARGPQVALVVGVESNPVTSERNHQIKIQFPWQRGTRPIAGGLTIDEGSAEGVAVSSTLGNAPGNEQSGTWVRVAESLSGPNWGSLFTPRIGTEVLVDFIDGDIDQPIVVACLYNGCDTPPFSAGVDSGVNHAGVISGHHSHGSEDASQYNQWVVDDTRAQCRMRLASSIGTSQLNLGYLIHQAPHSAVRGAYRGQGFELRSDAWGVLRGAQGVLLTTHSRANATSTQLDSLESRAQLTAAKSLAEVMQQAAQQQQAWHHPAASLAMVDGLKQLDPMQLGKFASEVNGQQALKPKSLAERTLDPQQPVEQFAQAVVHIDSAASMNFATAASSLLYAGEHLQWCTQADTHWAAAHSIANVSGTATSLFTHSGGLQAIAANGQVSLQAHTDALKLLADNDVTVISANGHIEIKAKKKISLMAGQAAVTLEGGNISFACPGKITVKGGQHLFDSASRQAAVLPTLPQQMFPTHKSFTQQVDLSDYIGVDPTSKKAVESIPYEYRTKSGQVLLRGMTDSTGETDRLITDSEERIYLYVGDGDWDLSLDALHDL